jgi:hypothetical protein
MTAPENPAVSSSDHVLFGVLLVFECGYKATLLEPFRTMHKAKFTRSGDFIGGMHNVNVIPCLLRHCNMHRAALWRDLKC